MYPCPANGARGHVVVDQSHGRHEFLTCALEQLKHGRSRRLFPCTQQCATCNKFRSTTSPLTPAVPQQPQELSGLGGSLEQLQSTAAL